MPRRRDVDLEKVTLNLRRGDMDYLTSICVPRGVAPSIVIRKLVSDRVDTLRAKEPKTDPLDLEGL